MFKEKNPSKRTPDTYDARGKILHEATWSTWSTWAKIWRAAHIFAPCKEEPGELCKVIKDELGSYGGFCFPGGAWAIAPDLP